MPLKEKGLRSKILSRLPFEVIRDILCRLPIEQLLQLRCCNKGFRHLIDDPYLRNLYNDRAAFSSSAAATDTTTVSFLTLIQFNLTRHDRFNSYDKRFYFAKYDDLSDEFKVTQPVTRPPILDMSGTGQRRIVIVGSCNGLVCLADHIGFQKCEPICVFNPVTGEELKLPPRKISKSRKSFANGFGYHPVTKEYKVVRIYYTSFVKNDQVNVEVDEVEVYTLGTGVWRSIGVPSLFNSISFKFPGLSSGMHVNGVLHWINDKEGGNVVSFDLQTEHFHFIPSLSLFQPPVDGMVDGIDIFYDPCVLTERLCVSRRIDYVSARVDIWALNKEDQSWTKEYDIAVEINPGTLLSSNEDGLTGDHMYPITLSKSGKLLLWYNDKILVSYDPKNGQRKIHGEYKAEYFNEIVVHVKSFVSLKALGEKGAKMTRIRNQRPRWRI